MKKSIKLTLCALALSLSVQAQAVTHAVIETNMGNIQLELDEVKAPKTVANFVNYAKKRFLRQHDFPPRYRQFYDSRRRIYREYGSKIHR